MDSLFKTCLEQMETWFLAMESLVPPPIRVPFGHSFVFRYEDRTLEQALIQKLARVVTGLRSARILVNSGMLQEQIAIHRMLDELQQDISFLAFARLEDQVTELHQQYLDAFYEEEFDDPKDPLASTQKRPLIPRQKIRAYLARQEAKVGISNPSRSAELTRTLSKVYSGFLHGASPQIMNMYGGLPPRFQISGMLGTPHELDHRKDLSNYFYRALHSFHEIAFVFADYDLEDSIHKFTIVYESKIGMKSSEHVQTET